MKTMPFILFLLLTFAFQFSFAQNLTAKQLYKEKRSNNQAFEKKYFNQTFTVSGKIWTITPCSAELPGFKNYHKIALTGTGNEMFIICQIPFSQKGVLDRFKTGQVITVSGTYNEKLLNYLLLNDCTFKEVNKEEEIKKQVTALIPLGKYSVYQQGGAGFAFQYQFDLKNYSSYTMNGKTGNASYDKKTSTLRFTSGLLKGFTGLFRPANPNNENDPPTIVLDPRGSVPDLNRITAGYQYAYFKE